MYSRLLPWGIDCRRMDIELELLLIRLSRTLFKMRAWNSFPLAAIPLSSCLYFSFPCYAISCYPSLTEYNKLFSFLVRSNQLLTPNSTWSAIHPLYQV